MCVLGAIVTSVSTGTIVNVLTLLLHIFCSFAKFIKRLLDSRHFISPRKVRKQIFHGQYFISDVPSDHDIFLFNACYYSCLPHFPSSEGFFLKTILFYILAKNSSLQSQNVSFFSKYLHGFQSHKCVSA